MKHWVRFILAVLLGAVAAVAQAGQNVAGMVRNGTDNQPAAAIKVTLVELQGAMRPVAETASDESGHYRFSQSPSSGGPYLVQVDFQGVSYFASVPTGQAETDLEIFDVSEKETAIHLNVEVMVVQPENHSLAVVDEYRVENTTSPKVSLFREGGLFHFRVPSGATVDGTRVVAPNGLPVERSANPTNVKDEFRVDTPLRPGETKVQVSYRLPYDKLTATLHVQPIYPTEHFEVYVPKPITLSGDNFVQVGDQDGYAVFGVPTEATAKAMEFTVAGDAAMPAVAAAANGDGGAAPSTSAAPAPAAPAAAPQKIWIERNTWMLAALMLLAAAGGLGWMFTKSPVPAPTRGFVPTVPPATGPEKDDLARLKDDLFLLEVRRHTGNLDEGEYQRLRGELHARMDALARR